MGKLTGRTELLTNPENNDQIHIVDTSDTTDDPLGTSKRIQIENFLGGPIKDANGLALITKTSTASAVNNVNVSNAATTFSPIISAIGTDTNIDLNLNSKGAGNVLINGSVVLTNPLTSDLGMSTFGLDDSSANELMTFTDAGTAINHVNLLNAAIGDGPTFTSVGDDTNVDFNLDTQGIGKIFLKATTTAQNIEIITGVLDVDNLGGTSIITVDASTNAELILDRGATGDDSLITHKTAGSERWVTGIDDAPVTHNDSYVIKRTRNGNPDLVILHGNGFVGIGIGSSSPSQMLQVNGNIRLQANFAGNRDVLIEQTSTNANANARLFIDSNSGAAILIERGSNARAAIMRFRTNGTNNFSIGLNNTGGFPNEFTISSGASTVRLIVEPGGALGIVDGITAPAATVGFAKTYVDSADGDYKIKFGNGFVAVLASDS